MKIHYKTIIVKEELKELCGEYQHFVLRDKKRNYLMDFCCDVIKEAIIQHVLYVQEVGNTLTPENEVGIYLQHEDNDGRDSYTTQWYLHPLKVCPFCGEEITIIEDYKAKTVSKKVRISAKTIPARNEMRTVEIKIN